MFGKKKEEQPKPSKFKIQMSIDRCKDSIQEMLDRYDEQQEEYLNKAREAAKQHRNMDVKRYVGRAKMMAQHKAKMDIMYDRVDQLSFMVEEAFAKKEFAATLGSALGEVSRVSLDLDVKGLMKDLKNFEDIFGKTFAGMDSVFDSISGSVNKVDESTSNAIDAEINERLDQEYDELEQQIIQEADSSELDLNF